MSTAVCSNCPMSAANQSCIRNYALKIIKPNWSRARIKPIHVMLDITGDKMCIQFLLYPPLALVL